MFHINFRGLWYSIVTSLLAFLVGNLVALPWYYLILPLVVVLISAFYFDRADQVRLILSNRIRRNSDIIFALGLAASCFWFVVAIAASILLIVNFYYFDVFYFLGDPRSWFLYPLVLLVPVIYSLALQNNLRKGRRKYRKRARLI